MRPRLLDLFCGAGGASVGYFRAGFDVTGVDIRPQPNYPFPFIQMDALSVSLHGFDVVHASPPCQAYSVATVGLRDRPAWRESRTYPDLVAPVRERLVRSGLPYVIENVEGAPLEGWVVMICGSGLGMTRIRRHRLFESNVEIRGVDCAHENLRDVLSVVGHATGNRKSGPGYQLADRRRAMGIDWMNRDELSESIPPRYTKHIGEQLMDHLRDRSRHEVTG